MFRCVSFCVGFDQRSSGLGEIPYLTRGFYFRLARWENPKTQQASALWTWCGLLGNLANQEQDGNREKVS
jgi:hypothetical protein